MINFKLAEKLFIFLLFLSIMFSAFLKAFVDNELLSSLLVVISSCVIVFFIIPMVVKNNVGKFLLFVFFCLRILLLYLDFYGKDLAAILHSGGDSERFYEWGLYISEDLSRMKEISYTFYTDFLAVLYWVIGDQRFFSQFINVILGMWSIFVFYKILDLFKLKDTKKLFFLALYGFYPQNIIFSSILLREAFIQFFFIYSILFFMQWIIRNNRINVYKTLFFVVLGAVFHSGMLFGLVVYGFVFLFFDPRKYKFNFSFNKRVVFVLFSGLVLIVLSSKSLLSDTKFSFLVGDDNQSIIEKYEANRVLEEAGANYLNNYEMNSVLDFVFIAPLKLIYFVFSPMPYDVRGFRDLIAVVLDSSFYYFLIYLIFKSRNVIRGSVLKIFPKIFFILFFIMSMGFALGTQNSATAIRHRAKILPALLIVIVFIESIKHNRSYIWNDRKID